MTYYCASCKRLTDGYDLWPNGECVCCYTSTEDLLDRDAPSVHPNYDPSWASPFSPWHYDFKP